MILKGQVVVVTGGAGLLGKTFVKAIVQEGGTAIIADIDENEARQFMKAEPEAQLQKSIEFFLTQIGNKENLIELIRYCHQKYGQIDALVNTAYPRNKEYGRKFFEVEYETFCENINLNLGGYFLASQQFAEYFIKQGHGNIINIASIYGIIAPRFEIYENTTMTMPIEYAVIKSGLIHLTRYMAKLFKGQQIRVNCISPGGIYDNQTETFVNAYKDYCLNKGMLDAGDITGALLFLLSDASKYMNGQNLVIDDGFTL